MVGDLSKIISKKIDDVQSGWACISGLPDGCNWRNFDKAMSGAYVKYLIHPESSLAKVSLECWRNQPTPKIMDSLKNG